jgi:hypothetical protein
MRNKASVAGRVRVAIAGSVLAFAWASASAAELASPSNFAAEFQTIASSDLLLLGPVDLVEPSKARVQVLGQWIPLSQSQISQSPNHLIGHVIAVYGSIAPDGSFEVAAVREQDSIDYVPGATHLYLKGSISALDTLRGTARIGSLSVSYSGALHSLVADDLAVGAVVSFSGLQYAENSKLYADNGLVHHVAGVVQTLGQTGSGAQALGQTGSGFQAAGQTGSGIKAAGQTGSGITALGQTGSGIKAAGQTGSGITAAGQTGSGIKASGQTGSGVTAAGQTGSGIKASGQTGSGIKAAGQTGSGITALGQTGSGITALGQTGSGITAMGQTGSGIKAAGQTGSGITAMGQTGSGITAAGQTGSGIKAAGQTGSGITAAGQTGSGIKAAGQTGSGF